MKPDELREETADRLDKMDEAVRASGIVAGEPLAPVLAEWRRSVAWAGELTARMAEIGQVIDAHVSSLSAGGLATVDPAALVRIEEAAVDRVTRRARDLDRAHNRRTALLTGAVVAAGFVLAAFGGYSAGRHSSLATASAIEAAAVRDGPQAADLWLRFMRMNDGALVARTCAETTAISDGSRKACALGLWLEPPVNSMPRTAPAGR